MRLKLQNNALKYAVRILGKNEQHKMKYVHLYDIHFNIMKNIIVKICYKLQKRGVFKSYCI